jgi:hypothetical protein
MKKLFTLSFIMILMIYSTTTAQCFSQNGIMNKACQSMTIIKPPAFEVSIGISNSHMIKADVNYITKNEIVYGGSFGLLPYHPNISMLNQQDATANAFLGYNLAGAIIIGVMGGVSHYTGYFIQEEQQIKNSGFNCNIGMSIKIITNSSSFPLTFGCYGSKVEIGISVGTIF